MMSGFFVVDVSLGLCVMPAMLSCYIMSVYCLYWFYCVTFFI